MAKVKLTPADNKFIAKFLNADGQLNFDAKTITRRNPYTGEEFELDPICAAAIDFVFEVEPALCSQNESALRKISPHLKLSNAVQNFDRARYIVAKLNPRAYMGILD